MKKISHKAILASLLPAMPMMFMIYTNFIRYRKGWNTLLIQYHTLFWLPRIVLAPFLLIVTLRLWKKSISASRFLFYQLAGFAVFNIICWGLSFISCRLVAMSFDRRDKNLFDTIRYESTFMNLLIYMGIVTIVLTWLYFEKRKESESKTHDLEKSLLSARLELIKLQSGLPIHHGNEKRIETLTVKNGLRTILIPVSAIFHIQSKGAYVKIECESGNYLLKRKLSDLQKILPATFQRVHRSHIVNLACIKELRSLMNGDANLVLKNGGQIRSSRTYRENLRHLPGNL